jgi:hypothetical protein
MTPKVPPPAARARPPGTRQLPKVIGIAFAVTSLVYLGLAVAVVASLGRSGGSDVPPGPPHANTTARAPRPQPPGRCVAHTVAGLAVPRAASGGAKG